MSPERLYLGAVALSGVAAVGSVVLPAAQRGTLAATVVSATLGSGIGGLSIDTFLLSRPTGWVAHAGRLWIAVLLGACAVLSAASAAVLIAVAHLGNYPIAMAGAAVLTAFNALGSLILRLRRFVFVYAMRTACGVVLLGGYLTLYLRHRLDGVEWGYVWLAAQLVAVIGLGAEALVRGRRFWAAVAGKSGAPRDDDATVTMPLSALEVATGALPIVTPNNTTATATGTGPRVRGDLVAIAKLHLGICAQMLTFRLDQILLARIAGAGPLGVYALAVSAIEFAQSGSVVTAQKILADRGPVNVRGNALPVLRAAAPVAVVAVAGLAVLGRLSPGYRSAWLLGLLLLPGCLAVSVGKAWSASLLKLRGEQATTVVAILTLAVSVPCYLVLVPWIGATGAALASSFVYALNAFASRLGLRRTAVVAAMHQVAA